MSPADEWVQFTEIVPESLARWDDATRQWVALIA
jgi:hypothetical protein